MVEHYTEAEIQKLQGDFKRRSQQGGKALRDMPLNDVYILLPAICTSPSIIWRIGRWT